MIEFDLESELGTLSYWEKLYARDLELYKESNNSEVLEETWFGVGCTRRILSYFRNDEIDRTYKVLDVGCGNFYFMTQLESLGFLNVTGIDYAPSCVRFAELVHKTVHQFDILATNANENDGQGSVPGGPFSIIHDKGTFDAIMLTPESAIAYSGSGACVRGKKKSDLLIEKYRSFIMSNIDLGNEKRTFVITSCNFVKKELMQIFIGWNLLHEIPHPTIKFGGETGQTVTTLLFRPMGKQ